MAGLGRLAQNLDKIANTTLDRAARKAVQTVVSDLQRLGPWWTGDFAKSWIVQVGDTNIPISLSSNRTVSIGDGKFVLVPREPRERLPLVAIPQVSGKQARRGGRYTIGNAVEHRSLAMDLLPGRGKGEGGAATIPPNTAPQDWFATYMEGGAFDKAISFAVQEEVFKGLA